MTRDFDADEPSEFERLLRDRPYLTPSLEMRSRVLMAVSRQLQASVSRRSDGRMRYFLGAMAATLVVGLNLAATFSTGLSQSVAPSRAQLVNVNDVRQLDDGLSDAEAMRIARVLALRQVPPLPDPRGMRSGATK